MRFLGRLQRRLPQRNRLARDIARTPLRKVFSLATRLTAAVIRFLPAPTLRVRCSVLVIDASPSMEENDWPPSRLAAAKESAHAFINRLEREDSAARIAIVAYGEQARTMCSLTPASDRRKLSKAVDGIGVQPCTNITAGLEQSLSILARHKGPCQVVLLTDGEHNNGPSPECH